MQLLPPPSYDFLLQRYAYAFDIPPSPILQPWVQRALRFYTAENALAAKHYKPVDRKVRPVPTYMPNPSAQVFKPIILPMIEPLPFHPPPRTDFVPTLRLTNERLDLILATVPEGFLSSAELDLLVFMLDRWQNALAFTDAERGTFSRDYFPDYEIPTIEHIPWQKPPIRIPKAIEHQVRAMMQDQIAAGKYEPSCASYRSRIFTVLKKSGQLRIVHDLQDLNMVTIRDSALPPRVDDFAESFVGHTVYMLADLYAGFDGRTLDVKSRDLTTFHSTSGPLRLKSLPQGATNATGEFQRDIDHVLGPEIPETASAFIDDCGVKGPTSDYNNEPIPGNPDIRRFVYEFATTADRVLLRFQVAGITASGKKLILATPRLNIVGSIVSYEGWHLEHGIVSKILNWPHCRNTTEVRGFVGTAGVGRRWIRGFALIAKPLTLLYKQTNEGFHFGQEAINAMDILKRRVSEAPVLVKIDYMLAATIRPAPRHTDHGLVTLAVDSSMYGSGWILSQRVHEEVHPALFGSCTFNTTESSYSQPKAELYGAFRCLKEMRHRIWGTFFCLEVDAKYLKEMLVTPDLPNAPMTRWIAYIKLFDFELKHIPAEKHAAPDGLSRRRASPEDSDDDDPEEHLEHILGLDVRSASYNPERSAFCVRSLILQDAYSTPTCKMTPVGVTFEITYMDDRGPPHIVSELAVFDSLKADAILNWERDQRAAYGCRILDANIVDRIPKWFAEHVHMEADRQMSPFLPSTLRNYDDCSFVGNDYMVRNEPAAQIDTFLLGNEIVTLEWVEYKYAYTRDLLSSSLARNICMVMTNNGNPELETIALRAGATSVHARNDHRFGPSYPWIFTAKPLDVGTDLYNEFTYLSCAYHSCHIAEIDDVRTLSHYLTDGTIPLDYPHGSPERRRFLARSQRFVLADGRLWRTSSKRAPCLVIAYEEKKQSLMREAHDECGH